MKCFITNDIISWPDIKQKYAPVLRENPHLAPLNPNSELYWDEFHKRVVEHVSLMFPLPDIKRKIVMARGRDGAKIS